MSPAWLSRCVSDVMDDGAVAFNELGLIPDFMALIRPNQLFSNPHSGVLGGHCLQRSGRNWPTATGW